MKKIHLILATVLFGCCTMAFSDTVYLKSGGRVSGKVTSQDADKVKVETSIGVMTVERKNIDKIDIDEVKVEVPKETPIIETTPVKTAAEAQDWYKLDEDEVYVTDFLLQAGQSKKISIDSTQPIVVGFITDAHYAPDSYALYKELSAKYKNSVIKMDSNSGVSMSTISGGSMMYEPVNGKIVIEMSNLIDRDFKIVLYKKNIDEEKKEASPSHPSEVAKFSAEGEVKFEKEGYIEQNGVNMKQPDAFCSVPIKGNKLEAIFEIFMMKESFNEKTFSNTPALIISCGVNRLETGERMYFGYNVAFFDKNKNMVARAVKTDNVKASYNGMSSIDHINLKMQEITNIKCYKVIFYESSGKISEQMLITN